MTAIFTIERRKDFPEVFTKFFEDLQSTVSTSTGQSYKMFNYLDIKTTRLIRKTGQSLKCA